MKFVSKLSYIIAVVVVLTTLVGCPVVQPDDTVKITELQTAIDKAASGDTITLSNYGDITNYNAKIDKPLTIDGVEGLFDLKNATLNINVNGVTIKKISNANVIIGADVGNGSCTIIGSSLANLTVSGCGMLSGSLILDNTTVETAVFNKTVNDNAEYVGLDIRNVSEIKRMTVDTSVALKSDTVYDARNAVSLNITPDKNQYAALAVLPEYRNDITEGNNIVSVRFYDPLLEDNEVKAQIDVLLKSGDVDSTVQRDFLIQSCKYLLGNVMERNIQSSIFGGKIESDTSVDIQNMVDTVNITFHNNLPDPTTDVIKVITNKEYAMPVIGFIHTEPETHTLHGWSKTAGSNTTDYAIGKAVKFSENTDLYAVWMTMYTISYRDKDGTGDVEFNAWNTEYSPQIYYFTDEIVTLPPANAVSKDGYIFCGWYEDKEYTSSAISGWSANSKTGNQTFYAKWEYCVSLSDILFRSGDTTMTVKWTNPNNASLSKIKINCNNGTVTEVIANAGERGSYTFNSLTNGTQYTCSLSAVDNKGNESKSQTINNYCGSYIGTDGSLYIKGTQYEKTAMKAVTDINTDVTAEGSEGAFISDRTVTLSPYRIGQYEVTQKLYQAITGSNPSSHIGDNYPVENVSRYDCLRMCRKLNELFGYENVSVDDVTIDISKEGFRLPTEAEWEFAARGGDPSAAAWDYTYSGSDTIGEVAWYADNSGKTTHEVGTKTHNSLGIYDMSGNVWEWAADTYIDDIPTGTVVNPLITSGNSFVQLGGGYVKTASFCKVTARTGDYNASKSKVCGFRLAINGKE